MNGLAGWLIAIGLICLGTSIEKAADKIQQFIQTKEKNT